MQTRKAPQPESITPRNPTSSKTVHSSNKVLGHNTVIKVSTEQPLLPTELDNKMELEKEAASQ